MRSCEALRQLGFEVEIASLDYSADPWIASCPVKVNPLGPGGFRYGKIKRLLPWLRYGYSGQFVSWLNSNMNRFDVLVLNGLWNFSALGSWLSLRKTQKPYFVYTHGMLDPWFRREYPLKHLAKQIFWLFSEGRLLAHARAVLFTAEEERRLAKNAFYPYRCTELVAGYGVPSPPADSAEMRNEFRTSCPELGEKPFLLFLGRLHPKKGCDLLIKAFSRMCSSFPYDLVLAGPDDAGWKSDLVCLANELGVSNRIHWPGMLKGPQKWGALHSCQALILPSHQENFGIVVAEALGCRKEVLVTKRVNIWQEVQSSDAGLVFEDTESDIEFALRQYSEQSEDEIIRRRNAARQLFLDAFEIQSSTIRIARLIEEAAVDPRR